MVGYLIVRIIPGSRLGGHKPIRGPREQDRVIEGDCIWRLQLYGKCCGGRFFNGCFNSC